MDSCPSPENKDGIWIGDISCVPPPNEENRPAKVFCTENAKQNMIWVPTKCGLSPPPP